MLLLRSLATGLMGGCLLLLVGFEPRTVIITQSAAPPPAVRAPVGATLIDIAGNVSPLAMSSLVKLDRGEHVTTVDDMRVDSDLAAGAAIAGLAHGHDSFVDLGVDGPSGPRRVLLLIH